MSRADTIVVGSGASAVHAAWALVAAGLRVLMIDVGSRDETYAPLIPEGTFGHIRRTDPNQHRYLLGDSFEGVPFGRVRVGAQLTPPRGFINRGVDTLTPVDAPDFIGLESLALGGLGAGWGAGLARFSDEDFAGVPLKASDLAPHYAAVEQRIGVSSGEDDLTPVLGRHEHAMPAMPIDTSAKLLLDRYQRRREALIARGFRLGVTSLAACSTRFKDRGPHGLQDMDFWADKARAVHRPRWTVEELSANPNFTYLPGRLVTAFRETSDGVELTCRRVADGETESYRGRALVLAAGVFGTARIVLRSLGLYDRPIPFVCNPSRYVPCINLNMIGREAADARHSLAQLSAYSEGRAGDPDLFASLYSYRSLLTFKLMKEAPLNVRSALKLMRSLIPLVTIAIIQHADYPTREKTVMLTRGGGGGAPDHLRIAFGLSAPEHARIDRGERRLLAGLRSLGCIPLKRIYPGHGSSIHYGGTFPMAEAGGELTTSPDGLLHSTRAVYLADGSLLRDLPCKALTLTLMAGGDRIGTLLARKLGGA